MQRDLIEVKESAKCPSTGRAFVLEGRAGTKEASVAGVPRMGEEKQETGERCGEAETCGP